MIGRRAIVHIGTYKTGSTSIQAFLDANAGLLFAKGFYYPDSLGRPNHHGLAVFALSDRETTGLIRYLNLHDREKREAKRAEIAAALNAELAGLPSEISAVVFSNEHLSGLNTEPEIESLRDLLAPHFDEIKIVVYLRRQDQRIVSDYTQKVRDGYTKPLDPLTYQPAESRDYRAFLEKWAKVFGEDAIAPRIFSRARFVDGDLIDDFLAAIGAPADPAYVRPEMENLGLSHEAIEFLRAFNEYVPHYRNGERNPVRMRLLPFLVEGFPGEGIRLGRGESEALLELVRESNEAVGARYFGGEFPFSNDLSRCGGERASPPSFEEAVKIAAFLWSRQAETINELKAENERRMQQLSALRLLVVAKSDIARSLAERLLAEDPQANDYYPTLLETFMALHAELRDARERLTRNAPRANGEED
ncbi:MAG: hypothetical protein ACOZAA_09310 [Pseudomonadota bacterium]